MKKNLFFIFSLYLYANIDQQIEAIRNAPPQKRYKLLKTFKKEIIKIHEQTCMASMKKLKSKSQVSDTNKTVHAKKK